MIRFVLTTFTLVLLFMTSGNSTSVDPRFVDVSSTGVFCQIQPAVDDGEAITSGTCAELATAVGKRTGITPDTLGFLDPRLEEPDRLTYVLSGRLVAGDPYGIENARMLVFSVSVFRNVPDGQSFFPNAPYAVAIKQSIAANSSLPQILRPAIEEAVKNAR